MLDRGEDVEGQCNAHFHFEAGRMPVTLRCTRPPGHSHLHGAYYESSKQGEVEISWSKDSRPECCQSYMHAPVDEQLRGKA